jgi:hypothetical protein
MPPVPPDQLSPYPYGDSATADIRRVGISLPTGRRFGNHVRVPPSPTDLDRVMTFAQWCERIGVSPATGRRILKSGRGPKVTLLSERRMGIRERHHLEWLDAQAETPTT